VAPLGYLEIVDAKGHVLERVRIDEFPVTIGRAYGNHVVIDDPYVCPRHVAIESDDQGRVMARDLDSVNGIHIRPRGKRIANLEVGAGAEFRIGRTWMRYRSVEHPLSPTLVDREGGESRLASPYMLAGAGVLLVAVLCLDSYLSAVERITVAKIVSEPLTTVVMLLIWCGAWALASRIVIGRFHFSPHAVIASAAMVAVFMTNTAAEWTEFLFPIVPALRIAGILGTGVVLAAMLYGHLRFASMMRRSARLWTALAVSVAAVGASWIWDYAGRSKFSNVMEFTGIVKPLDAALLPTVDIERFIDNSQKLRTDLDALAQKAKASQP
jgi:hypothetical protein